MPLGESFFHILQAELARGGLIDPFPRAAYYVFAATLVGVLLKGETYAGHRYRGDFISYPNYVFVCHLLEY